jgi:hypothetical protein
MKNIITLICVKSIKDLHGVDFTHIAPMNLNLTSNIRHIDGFTKRKMYIESFWKALKRVFEGSEDYCMNYFFVSMYHFFSQASHTKNQDKSKNINSINANASQTDRKGTAFL